MHHQIEEHLKIFETQILLEARLEITGIGNYSRNIYELKTPVSQFNEQ